MKKTWIIVIVVAVAALIALRLAGNKKKIEEKKKITVESNVQIPVNVATAAMDTLNESLIKTGTLVAWQDATVSATSSGNLLSVSFDLGSVVGKGAVMAQIDNRLLQLKLEAAELQQKKLQKDYERFTVLLKGDATTETNLQDIKYNLDNATNQISQIRKQIADNLIKAPISGQVVEKKVEVGEFVNPGTVLARIVDVAKLKADIKVSEQDAYKLRKGQKVVMTTDLYPSVQFEGAVLFVSQEGDAAHNYQVQIGVTNTSAHPLKAGTFVYADFSQKSSRAVLMIPRSALVESMKNPYVYVVENGKAVSRKIVPGGESGDKIEVLEGLTEGEQVVMNGQINLANGSAVRIVK